MKRVFWIAVAALLALAAFYLSRFWTLQLWGREGLWGIEALRPRGSLLGQWLRGTPFQPFELLIWAIGVFGAFSVIQKLYDLINPPPKD